MRFVAGILIIAVGILSLAGCNSEPSMDTSRLPPPVNTAMPSNTGNPEQLAAADALGRIGQPAVTALAQALEDADPVVRLQACRALAYMGLQAKDAVPDLTRTLNDPNEAVREHAAQALGQIGGPSAPAVPTLMQMLRAQRQ